MRAGIEDLGATGAAAATLLIVVSVALIFAALWLLVRTMRSVVQDRVEVFVTGFLGRSAALSFVVGVIVTVMVQSSSVTTSLVLGTRYYKRVGAHLLNLLSSVVMPLHKVDYYDEDELPRLAGDET